MNQIKLGAGVGCALAVVGVVGILAAAGWAFFGLILDVIGPDLFVFLLFVVGALGCSVVMLRAMAWVARAWWAAEAERNRAAVTNEFVYADTNGLLPLAADQLRSANGTALAMQNNMMSHWKVKVEPDRVPKSLTYAPHVSYRNQGADSAQVDPAKLLAALDVQSISQLWESNSLPRSGFLVGYDLETQKPVTANWDTLYSALIGGESGSGKSTLVRSLLAQSALQGGRFVVIDPHYGAGDQSLGASLQPLRNLMLCDVAADDKQIREALGYVDGVGQRRLKGLDPDRTPLVLVVDETTGLMQRSAVAEALGDSLGQIAQETRKVGVYAFCIGQNFDGRVMDTTIRNSFVSQLSCRARRTVARVQADDPEFGKMAAGLTIGQCVWRTIEGIRTLQFPNCTQQDLEAIATQISGKNVYSVPAVDFQVVDPGSKHGSGAGSKALPWVVAEPTPEPAIDWNSPQIQCALDLLRLGYTQSNIIKEAFGVEGKGRAYQEALGTFRQMLSELAKGKIQ